MSVDTQWELICHHTYKWAGTATDLSVYDSHGTTTGLEPSNFRQDGATPGSGAWRFHATTRDGILIQPNAGWGPLVGVRVEFTARVNTVGFAVVGATLIDADNSFHIGEYQRHIGAKFRGDPVVYGPSWDWVVSGFQMKNGQWVRFVWEHDGLTEMRLTIEGAEIVRHLVLSGVPAVGPKGISIGNRLDGKRPWTGDIDEVKVWRLNPHRVRNQFLGRSIDKETADCWARYVESMRAAFAKYPDCARQLTAGMRDAVNRSVREIAAQGPETRQRTSELAGRYAELWATNDIDGTEMRQAISDLVTWLRLIGVQPDEDERTKELKSSRCWKLITGELAGLECDPKITAMIEMFADAGECGSQRNQGTA
ncbi:LamG domain-containing protein [Mycolicibacterium psychrotolerans]|uniref:Uncharacterized protein n=1 Tax=Mycolicibacterium psychrotolerans TaxID=216929 RepID=A0A7I7M8T5_9MYCO|nr:LamG domain-containing protein [Mycolicibacterium psychrotolerans]BBX68638.1 hypothetical protein MPSYJ_20990 [Mycolicibacterium psychrotolerans]